MRKYRRLQKQEVAKAIKKAEDSDRLDLATLLVMTWYTAGRTCDILQLKKENVEVRSDGHLLVTFKRGKTVHARGGWTVHTKLPHGVALRAAALLVHRLGHEPKTFAVSKRVITT